MHNMYASSKKALYYEQHRPMGRPKSMERVYNMTVVMKEKEKTGWLLPCLGVTFILLGLFIFIVNPINYAVTEARRFGPGTYMYEMWFKPPTKVSLRFYIFNYTNSEAFLRGEVALRIQEIGPYTYTEEVLNRNVTFNENNTMTYEPTHVAIEDLELTVGDPMMDTVVVPNFVFLGLASYLADSSYFTNIAFNVFTRLVKSEPFLTMTVDEYLRGYDEPLLSYANKILPGMVSFDKMGYLDRIVNEGDNVITMSLNDKTMVTGDGRVVEPFTVDQFNGSPGMPHWGYREEDNTTHKICNTLQGLATEGMLVPRRITKQVRVQFYRKSFCRTLPIVYDREGVTNLGVPAYWLKFSEDAFHNTNPENSCYCDREQGECLPDGLSDIGACLFNLPIAVSSPHFLYGDPSLVQAWEGLNPNFEEHGSSGLVDNNFGVIMKAKLRVQLNLIMKKTRYNGLVRPFNGMVLPAMWAEYCFNDLPFLHNALLYIAVMVLPVVHYVLIAILTTAGVTLLLRALLRLLETKSMYRRLSLQRASSKSSESENNNLDVTSSSQSSPRLV